ncbi:hypothetical protein FHS31_002342 [Sphingomonas vulcanisoli]|uniref:Uncharacterized protein n=1 Tax=Sphingomonas vulcanisoli TaxID=1658060 RepID=A0ABX0TTD8_9SPHN|nr:hypothetical protein [Sphingomonas vulcanisoli]
MLRPPLAVLAISVILGLACTGAAQAQAPAALPPGMQTPTTKILAVGHVTPKWSPAAGATVMPQEVRATVALYLEGERAHDRRDGVDRCTGSRSR